MGAFLGVSLPDRGVGLERVTTDAPLLVVVEIVVDAKAAG